MCVRVCVRERERVGMCAREREREIKKSDIVWRWTYVESVERR